MTPPDIDPEAKELLEALSAAVVPRNRRKAVYLENWHTPYYSHGRYTRL